MIGVVGLFVTGSFFVALRIGRKGVGNLASSWAGYRQKASHGYHEIGVMGYIGNKWENFLAPWNILPYIIILWLGVILFGLIHPGLPPTGAFNLTPNVKSGASSTAYFDTCTGGLHPVPQINKTPIDDFICDNVRRFKFFELLVKMGTRQCL